MSGVTFIRPVPQLHFREPEKHAPRQMFEVWNDAPRDAWIVTLRWAGFDASMQTTREGIEAIRDACNIALVHEEEQA